MSDWWVEMAGSGAFVPYLNVTTHLDDTPDQDLLSEKGGNGFPYLVLMDSEGVVLARRFRPTSADAMKSELKAAAEVKAELDAMRKKAEKNPRDKKLQAELAIELALRFAPQHSMEELKALSMVEGLDEDLVSRFNSWYAEKRFNDAYAAAVGGDGSRDEKLAALGESMLGLFKEGVRLPADSDMAAYYYDYAVSGAISAKDEESARACFILWKECMDHMAEQMPQYAEDIQSSIDEMTAKIAEAFPG